MTLFQAPLIYGLFTPQCYNTLFTQLDFLNIACLSFVISKLLSYAIISGSVLVKLPQIMKIIRSGSAIGLQPSMYLLECVGYTALIAYNKRQQHPFSSYGENIFLVLQGVVLMLLVAYYQHKHTSAVFAFTAVVYSIFTYVLLLDDQLLSTPQLALLQSLTIPIFAVSKLPQIYNNYQQQSTGQLSVVTIALNTFGSAARVFTTMREVNDQNVLLGVVVGVVLNATLFAQIIMYWTTTAVASSKTAAKKMR